MERGQILLAGAQRRQADRRAPEPTVDAAGADDAAPEADAGDAIGPSGGAPDSGGCGCRLAWSGDALSRPACAIALIALACCRWSPRSR
jgi:hypothetical protein